MERRTGSIEVRTEGGRRGGETEGEDRRLIKGRRVEEWKMGSQLEKRKERRTGSIEGRTEGGRRGG